MTGHIKLKVVKVSCCFFLISSLAIPMFIILFTEQCKPINYSSFDESIRKIIWDMRTSIWHYKNVFTTSSCLRQSLDVICGQLAKMWPVSSTPDIHSLHLLLLLEYCFCLGSFCIISVLLEALGLGLPISSCCSQKLQNDLSFKGNW